MQPQRVNSLVLCCVALGCLEAASAMDCGSGAREEQKVRFTTPRSYELANSDSDYRPIELLTGDFDGDAIDDILVGAWPALQQRELALIQSGRTRELPPPARQLIDFYGGYLVPGDFDGQAGPDVVMLNAYDAPDPRDPPPHQFLLLKNDGAGRFSPAGPFEAGEHPSYGTAADFDRDGDLDLAVSRSHQNKHITDVSVILNQEGGTFAAPVSVPAIWDQREIASGDLDGDGLPEIIVGGRKDTPPFEGGRVAVLPNLGGGQFGQPKIYTVSHPDTVWTLQVADMDGDGALDVVEGSANWGTITVLFNDGTGALPDPVELRGISVIRLRLGDLDGDGLLDIVSRGGGVHRNLGGRRFAEPVFHGVGGFGEIFQLADVDGDAKLDWAITHNGGYQVLVVLYNEGGGRLAGVPVYNIGQDTLSWSAGWLVGGDFDRDGDPDLAVMGVKRDTVVEHLKILRNRGDGAFERGEPHFYPKGNFRDFGQQHLLTADLDGDRAPDLATCGWGSSWGVGVLWNDGKGAFSEPQVTELKAGGSPGRIAAADFDLDGDLDLATGNNPLSSWNVVSILWNVAPRVFGEELAIAFTVEGQKVGKAADMAAGDFDRDGDPDVAILHRGDEGEFPTKITLVRNDGERLFTASKAAEAHGWATISMAAGDLDGDGSLDLITSSGGLPGSISGILTTFRNDGRGNFTLLEELHPRWSTRVLNLADVDQDGDLDLMQGAFTELQLFLNDGTGRFGEPVNWFVDINPQVVVAGDFNRDGKTDLAVTSYEFGNVAVLLNEAGGAPSGPAGQFRRGDVDGSGSSDILDDVVTFLLFLFDFAPPLACPKAADVDDDGRLQINDAVYLLSYYFRGGEPPPEPFRSCGLDPTPDSLGDCRSAHWSCR